jgi:Tfp pilus assembly protein PilN
MIGGIDFSKLESGAARLTRAAVIGARWVAGFLTLSLGHDALWPQRNLAANIERGRLSIVYGSRLFSRISVKGARFYPCEAGRYPSPDAVAASLILAAADLRAPWRDVTLVIPRQWAMARRAALPAAVKDNLIQAIAFELDRFTPITAEDALYDFHTVSENEDRLEVFLAACRADVVAPYIRVLADQGINVARVATTFSAMGACCGYLLNDKSMVFAEVTGDGYEGGLLVDQRLAAVFGEVFDGKSADEKVGCVKEGLRQRSGPAGNGLREAIMMRDESISPAAFRRSFATAEMLNDVGRRKLHMNETIPSLTMAETGSVVESLWPRAQGLNLLSKGYRKKTRSPFALTVVLLAAILTTVVVYATVPLNIEQKRLDEIERQIRLMKPAVRQVEGLKKEIDLQEKEMGAIENFKKGRPLTIDLLKEITNVLPKSVWLTRARITETTVDLEGYAGSAAEILPKLESSPFLKKVEFASPTFRDARLGADRFVIKAEIEGEKKSDTGGSTVGIKK